MPYPFAPMPKFKNLKEKFQKNYGVTIETAKGTVVGPRGQIYLPYFKRCVDGRVLTVDYPRLADDEHLTPAKLRNLCQRLEIPPKEFGLTLDDLLPSTT